MKITYAEKINIRGALLKGKITSYHDLLGYIQKRVELNELLETILGMLFKNLETQVSRNLILNSLIAIDTIILDFTALNVGLDNELVNQIKEIEDKYNQALVDKQEKENEDIKRKISEIKEDLVGNCMIYSKDEDNVEEVTEEKESEEKTKEELTEKITSALLSLQSEVDSYKEQVKKLEKTTMSSEKKIAKREATIEEQKQELKELRVKVKDYQKQTDKQDNTIRILEQQNEEQSSIISDISAKQERATRQIEASEKTISELNEIISIYQKDADSKKQKEYIEEEIFKILSNRDVTVEELASIITHDHNGNKVSNQLVFECLMNLKNKIKITSNEMRNFSPVYSIGVKRFEKNKVVNIPISTKAMDILLVSDMHFGLVGKKDILAFDCMYDYCAKNGINLILNLGDLFSYDYQANSDRYNRMQYNSKILETAIKNLPYDKNIHQAILGGNHDCKILDYGVDPIDVLASSRRDIINLGYEHANVAIGENSFMLHHINKRFPEAINGKRYDNSEFIEAINEYYNNSPFEKDNTYVDLFGHFHKSILNEEDGYALVPSLTCDRIQNGAWHLKVYFNELGKIENIIFIPVIYENKFIPVNETVYTKTKRK